MSKHKHSHFGHGSAPALARQAASAIQQQVPGGGLGQAPPLPQAAPAPAMAPPSAPPPGGMPPGQGGM